jgi:hypothetical protein
MKEEEEKEKLGFLTAKRGKTKGCCFGSEYVPTST